MYKPCLLFLGALALVSCSGSEEVRKETSVSNGTSVSNDAPQPAASEIRRGSGSKDTSRVVYPNGAPTAAQRRSAEEINAAMNAVPGRIRVAVMRLVSCRAREKLIPSDWSARPEAIRKAASEVEAGLSAQDRCGRRIASSMGGMSGSGFRPAE